MAIYFYYIALAFLCILMGYINESFLSIVFYWASASFFVISTAYIIHKPNIFRKNSDGRIPLYINILLWPFITGVYIYNTIARRLDKTDKMHQIDKRLFVATRLNTQNFTSGNISNVNAIVDMTAEFSALDWGASALDLHYLNVPTLDHQAPDIDSLNEAITWIDNHIEQGRNVVVHCALGRGRSVFVAAAYLLTKYPHLSTNTVLDNISAVRTQAGLNPFQLKYLTKYRQASTLKTHPVAWLIVNPAAGGGKWQEYKVHVMNQLYKHFLLTVKETTKDITAKQLTQQAITKNIDIIIVAGGDGTLREVSQEVVNTNIKFGLIPMGTANALAHNLYGHLSKITPVELALTHLCSKQTVHIDTATCNQKTALLLAGIGLEYEMINYADRETKNDMGQFAYLNGFWKAYTSGTSYQLKVTFDDKPTEIINTTSFVVANAAPFTSLLAQGNGTPNFEDGLLDVTWIKADMQNGAKFMGLGELISSGLRIKNESINATHQHIQTQQVKKIHINSDQIINYVIDGELFTSESLAIEINPKSLQVFMKK